MKGMYFCLALILLITMILSPLRVLNYNSAEKNESDFASHPDYFLVKTEENDEIQKISEKEYVIGVLAGEMSPDNLDEALKAQAILARTYTLYYLQNFKSKYEGADISNDVTEAQAYDASKINDKVKSAVKATKGKVVLFDDEYYIYFNICDDKGTQLKSSEQPDFEQE
jgi:peptidoglycan hydrolase-like amidase